jgi:hypothetical protein
MLATTARAEDRFDLVCTGTRSVAGGPGAPWAARYRVDLVEGVYCRDECKAVPRIFDVGPSVIVFARSAPDAPESFYVEWVSRMNGTYSATVNPTRTKVEGACATEPFSGFPAAKF